MPIRLDPDPDEAGDEHHRLSGSVVLPAVIICGALVAERSLAGYGPATWLGSIMGGLLILMILWGVTYWRPLRFLYVPLLWLTALGLLVRLVWERGLGAL